MHRNLLKSHFTSRHEEKGESVLPMDNLAFSGSVLPFVIHISFSIMKCESPQHFLFPKYVLLLWAGYVKPTDPLWKPSCNALTTNVETAGGISRSAWHQAELKRSRKSFSLLLSSALCATPCDLKLEVPLSKLMCPARGTFIIHNS